MEQFHKNLEMACWPKVYDYVLPQRLQRTNIDTDAPPSGLESSCEVLTAVHPCRCLYLLCYFLIAASLNCFSCYISPLRLPCRTKCSCLSVSCSLFFCLWILQPDASVCSACSPFSATAGFGGQWRIICRWYIYAFVCFFTKNLLRFFLHKHAILCGCVQKPGRLAHGKCFGGFPH